MYNSLCLSDILTSFFMEYIRSYVNLDCPFSHFLTGKVDKLRIIEEIKKHNAKLLSIIEKLKVLESSRLTLVTQLNEILREEVCWSINCMYYTCSSLHIFLSTIIMSCHVSGI